MKPNHRLRHPGQRPTSRSWKRTALGAVASVCFGITAQAQTPAEIGLVAHWPLDETDGVTTPDIIGGFDMTLNFMDGANVVPGKTGNAFVFDGIEEILTRVHSESEDLPIYQHDAYTVSIWVKGIGTGQNDKRVFSEGSSLNNTPLLNIGTHSGGANGAVDMFVRPPGVHVYSTNTSAFDGEWRHIVWVDINGTAQLYIDGVADETNFNYAKTTQQLDSTSIGAIQRAAACCWFNGEIDEVSVYKTALTQDQVTALFGGTAPSDLPLVAPSFQSEPVGGDFFVGERTTLSGATIGSPGITYQWQKDGENVPGATSPTLELLDLAVADSGDYTLIATNGGGAVTSAAATITVTAPDAPNLPEGLVSYWPFDEIDEAGLTTPDYIGGNDLTLVSMDSSNLVPGQSGNALLFNNLLEDEEMAFSAAGQTVSDKDAFTVAFWVQANGVAQLDRRVFSEGSSVSGTPLFNLGTDNEGITSNLETFIRTASGTAQNHPASTQPVFDFTWRHVVWTDDNGDAKLYIDGVQDATDFSYIKTPMGVNTVSVGGIMRAAASHWFSGTVDEVAVWNRALRINEVEALFQNGLDIENTPKAPTITQQPASVSVFSGDTVVFTGNAVGSQPLEYQWFLNDAPIDGATAATLTLNNVQTPAQGRYHYTVTNSIGTATSGSATLSVTVINDITTALVSYWPLDTVSEGMTPDVIGGLDMMLNNMDNSNLVPGQKGNALAFRATADLTAAEAQLLTRINQPGDALPVYNNEAYTISFWVNAVGTGQTDRRVFSEGSTTAGNPLLNIGTDNTGASDVLDIYLRGDGGAAALNHVHSTQPVFDGQWRHVVWVDNNGAAELYVDGVLDDTDFSYTRGTLTVNTTSIGGILRAAISHWFVGELDEVAVWGRALSQSEVISLYSNGLEGGGSGSLTIEAISLGEQDEITLTIASDEPNRAHTVEMKSAVDGTEWTAVDGVTFSDLGGGQLSASFTRPAGEKAFFRIVRQGPVPALFEDFESGAAGWTTGTDNGQDIWEVGTPSFGIDFAFSGDNVFGTALAGPYIGAGGSSWLRSPAIDLTGQTTATLIFQEVRDTESGFDEVIINVLDANSPSTVLAEVSRRSGARLQWTERAFALPSEALGKSVILEFILFQSDEFQDIEQAGWLIDDVTIILE
jgi:hypothetical protein